MGAHDQPTPEEVLNSLFLIAREQKRTLTAQELMGAIGLSRTNINGTYAHINERRKAHNAAIRGALGEEGPQRRSTREQKLRASNAELRRQIAAERERSEQYGRVIARLTLENFQLKNSSEVITDARARFRDNRPEA